MRQVKNPETLHEIGKFLLMLGSIVVSDLNPEVNKLLEDIVVTVKIFPRADASFQVKLLKTGKTEVYSI